MGSTPEHDDPFRYCIYCDADCYADEPEHADDCPSGTGVYPVTEQLLKPICPHCGESLYGLPRCMDCGEPFKLGDRYMYRVVEAGDPLLPGIEGAEVREVICIGCAAWETVA
jgi:predicted RNA-binding Zn-ribbon protein involved in translation (DUF1610 family)